MKTRACHLIAVAALLLLGGAYCVDAAGQNSVAVGDMFASGTKAAGHCALASLPMIDMACKGERCALADQIIPEGVLLQGARASETKLPPLNSGNNQRSVFAANDDGQSILSRLAANSGNLRQQPHPPWCALAANATKRQKKNFDKCVAEHESKDFCSLWNANGDRFIGSTRMKPQPPAPKRVTTCALAANPTDQQKKRFDQCVTKFEPKSLRYATNANGDRFAKGRLLKPRATVCALSASATEQQRKRFDQCMAKIESKDFCSYTNWQGGRIVRSL